MNEKLDRQWEAAVSRHAEAVGRYLASAAAVPEELWRQPVAEGKWTPAEITEHVLLAYRTLVDQVRGGRGLRVQTGWLMRNVLRVAVLAPIMMTRRLPPGARAPRALRPGEAASPRDAALEELRRAAAEFEAELSARRHDEGLRLTHHLFGAVRPLKAIDFVAIHTEHHGRQLPAPRARSAGSTG